MNRRLPIAALLLGLAGLIPFIVCGLAAAGSGDSPETDTRSLAVIGYGAVILAFLGGVHWGFVFERPDAPGAGATPRHDGARLVFGVIPSLIGWLALLASFLAGPTAALALLVAGFLGTVITEARLARRGLVPPAYMPLRWGLSVVVLLILVALLTLRLVNTRVGF